MVNVLNSSEVVLLFFIPVADYPIYVQYKNIIATFERIFE